MAKELTLEQLAKTSAKPSRSAATGGNNVKPISASQLTKDLEAQHPEHMAEKNPNVVDAPLVADAFKAMEDTIAEKKRFISEEVMPIVYQNAEEMALEQMENPNNGEFKELDGRLDHFKERIDKETDPDVKRHLEERFKEQEKALNEAKKQAALDYEDMKSDEDLFADLDEGDIFEKNNVIKEEEVVMPQPENVEYTNNMSGAAARMREMAVEQEKKEEEAKKEEVKPEPVAEAPKPEPVKKEKKEEVLEPDNIEDLDSLLADLGIDDDEKTDDIVDDEDPEDMRQRIRESFSDVNIIKDPIDIMSFKIRSEPTSSAAVLRSVQDRNQKKRSDWVLYYTGRCVTFEECKGPELDNLIKTVQASNNLNGVIAGLQFLYNHIVDANKPKFEQWTKMIRTEDIESLYFGLYKACYTDSNLIPRTCTNGSCKKTTLIDCNIGDMVKYLNDDVKKECDKLFHQDTTTPTNKIKSTLLQISDDFVISYSEPTLFKTFIQYASLSDTVLEKYSATLTIMAYVDNFFAINKQTRELIPMAVKEYPNNLGKTVKSKLRVFIEILKSLNNDQYAALYRKLNNIMDEELKVSYVYPECKCPECGTTLAEMDIDSCMNMLFTRAQLAQV